MVSSPSFRRPRSAPSLQSSLLALVVVPVLGLTGAVGLAVDARQDTSRAAETAAAEVRAAVALDAVRGSVAEEVMHHAQLPVLVVHE